MSPWVLYLTLQLDHVHSFLAGILGIPCLIAVLAGLAWALATGVWAEGGFEPEADELRVRRIAQRYFLAGIISILLLGGLKAVLPTTKNMAAVLVVPAIINNETLQEDATELYDLAKARLKSALVEEEDE